jgi:hypothetical protein
MDIFYAHYTLLYVLQFFKQLYDDFSTVIVLLDILHRPVFI